MPGQLIDTYCGAKVVVAGPQGLFTALRCAFDPHVLCILSQDSYAKRSSRGAKKMSQKLEFHNLDHTDDGLLRDLAPGVTTRIFSGEQAMLSVVTFGPHTEGTLHHHPEEQWGVLLEGSGVRIQGSEEFPVKKGDFWRTPGNVPHTMRAGPQGARVLDIFSPPRPEYKKPGSGFGAA
jgi:quercetin dioxygenase-like cupin family protein